MPTSVELYDHAYGNYELDAYREVRIETYGHDLGQTSWVSMEESAEIPRLLKLNSDSFVLEIGCGSGRYALKIAEEVKCRILGIDINPPGVRNAQHLASQQVLADRASFQRCDVSQKLPFNDEAFSAVFSNDVLCHIPGRPAILEEIRRVLKPGGHLLFSDALVIGGMISHQEIANRSSIGYYVFSPPGENERLIGQAGLSLLNASDTTDNASQISRRWHDAREKRKGALISAEGKSNFEGLQSFLLAVNKLTSERRLLRFLYLAQKPA